MARTVIVPRHLAIIPDGNRRWAASRGLLRAEGHRRAFLEVTPRVVETAWAAGVEVITLWMFSTDNWRRDPEEIESLMAIFTESIPAMAELCVRHDASLRHLGRRERLPPSLSAALSNAPAAGARVLNLAIDYGGRDEIMRAAQRMMDALADPHSLDENQFSHFFDLDGAPPPDLVLRTSGEQRLSGFMPWHACYSELAFLPKLYPDLQPADLQAALAEYATRDRRFGS